ncbi:MAG: chemotaxis protein CheA [Oscillospiraceae bacterium]|jgi:two-component system chemotaxis sensor kinase CheA|nr:chemotaxis protein CheA [Oscillospiraceae bacterium]
MHEQDPMLDVFIFETQQLLETLEETLLQSEKEKALTGEHINEIFRIMHTIKGSASMMSLDYLAKLAHALEDLFDKIRAGQTRTDNDSIEGVIELVLVASDIFKSEIDKLSAGIKGDGDFSELIGKVHRCLASIQGSAPDSADTHYTGTGSEDSDLTDYGTPLYKIRIVFDSGCQMENLRAFGVVNALTPHCQRIIYKPADLNSITASEDIINNGFVLYIQSGENPDILKKICDDVMFLQNSSLIQLSPDNEELPPSMRQKTAGERSSVDKPAVEVIAKQNFISVNVNKLDKLMNLMGEIVTTESMVTKNPEVTNLHIDSFERSSQELRKLINELQDIVMSIRMLPVSNSFQKMHRIVRDVSKKVGKEVELVLIGEETEVDKNIIDTLSDPLMHLIRNSVDHGIELPEERLRNGKPATGTLTLEARNAGGDVVIIVSDDGQGLDRDRIVKKATEKGLTTKPDQDISDKEAYQMIFMPGFSTNTEVTEFSGRGVGMDVVKRNIDKVGGSISIESTPSVGMTVQIRIPLTLAIIDGMLLRVGKLVFIAPMLSIQESFKPNDGDVFLDPDGSEMIMIRGECYPVFRLYRIFDIAPDFENLDDGILIMISTDATTFCLFVDELIGDQQAVIKPLPDYILKHNVGMHGIGGCAVLGDGSISLIIDINSLVE